MSTPTNLLFLNLSFLLLCSLSHQIPEFGRYGIVWGRGRAIQHGDQFTVSHCPAGSWCSSDYHRSMQAWQIVYWSIVNIPHRHLGLPFHVFKLVAFVQLFCIQLWTLINFVIRLSQSLTNQVPRAYLDFRLTGRCCFYLEYDFCREKVGISPLLRLWPFLITTLCAPLSFSCHLLVLPELLCLASANGSCLDFVIVDRFLLRTLERCWCSPYMPMALLATRPGPLDFVKYKILICQVYHSTKLKTSVPRELLCRCTLVRICTFSIMLVD